MNSHGNLEETHTMTWQTTPDNPPPRLHISITISDDTKSYNASQSITQHNPHTQLPETILKVAQAAAALYDLRTWTNLQKLLPQNPTTQEHTQPPTNS